MNVKEIGHILRREISAGVSSARRFLRITLWVTVLGSLLLSGVILWVQLRKEQLFAREMRQSRVYVPGQSDASSWLTVDDLALPAAPVPKVKDYYLWMEKLDWTDEDTASYWSDADALTLAELTGRNRQQLADALRDAR